MGYPIIAHIKAIPLGRNPQPHVFKDLSSPSVPGFISCHGQDSGFI